MALIRQQSVFLRLTQGVLSFVLSATIGLLAGCSPVVVPLPLVDGGRVEALAVARVDAAGPMAISADGRMVATGDNALNLFALNNNRRIGIRDLSPDALCWSPDGNLLAVAFFRDNQSQLNILERSGSLVYEQPLPGRVGRLQWPPTGGLAAGSFQFEAYTFGTHVSEKLLRWDERWQMTEITLYETTLMPKTVAQLSGRMHQSFDFDLSPLGDEVLYTRVNAPPAFAASRHLILHNLQTQNERQLATLPLLSGTGRLAADGESVLISDGSNRIRMQDMWSERILGEWPGSWFDYDAATGLLVADGQVYKDQSRLFEFPVTGRAQFSSAGQFLLLEWNKQLYRLSSYPASRDAVIISEGLATLHKLRRLRSRGLIEQAEYLQAKERLLR